MKPFWRFAGLQSLNYTILVLNMRAVAHGNLALALITDAIYAVLFFTIIKKIAADENTKEAKAGYVLGSLIGTTIGMQF